MTQMQAQDMQQAARPWWRHPMMWLVVGGPAAVVLASFVTLGLAISHPDPVVSNGAAAAGDSDRSAAVEPAMKARSHAATGGRDKP